MDTKQFIKYSLLYGKSSSVTGSFLEKIHGQTHLPMSFHDHDCKQLHIDDYGIYQNRHKEHHLQKVAQVPHTNNFL